MDIERMTDEQINEYIKLRQQENPSDYSYQPKGPSKPGVMGTALVELDKDGNPRKSKQYLNSIAPKLDTSKGAMDIDAEIERLQALKEQNNQAQTTESNNPADGIYNPADYISQITSKMNEAGYTDEKGNKKSYGRGDKFSKNLDVAKNAGKIGNRTEDQFGNPLPDTAYEYITQMLNSERAKGSVSKHTLRMIENEAKARYNLPRNFDISGKGWIGNTDAAMARAMNSMAYNGKTQQAQQTKPAQTPQTQGTQSAQTPQTQGTQSAQTSDTVKKEQEKPVSPKTQLDDERTVAYKRIKSKQASDADLALFKNYTEEQLKKIGFGPISIEAIKGMQAINSSNGLSDDKQFMQQYSKAAGSRKPEDRAFLTPENAKRYSDLVHKQNETKKASKNTKKIEKLRQELEAHKKIMAENPDRPDIQKAQQTWVDNITKDIQKLGGSVE